MDPDGSGEVDMYEWMAACKKQPILMKPAFNSQRILREKIWGLKYWVTQQKKELERQQDLKKAGQQK